MKITSNEQGKCPVCGNAGTIRDVVGLVVTPGFEYIDLEDAEDAGCYKSWECGQCNCNGREYYDFADHYDVYDEEGNRIDSESKTDFPYLKRDRLLILLQNAISVIHETTGEDPSYEHLYDLQDEIGITEEEYERVMKAGDK